MKKSVSILLSLCLGLFLVEAGLSLLGDTLILLFNSQALAVSRGMLGLLSFGMMLIIYVLIGITPSVPKRYFLPIVLFNPVAALVAIPLSIYYFHRIPQISWVISCSQVIVGLIVLRWAQSGFAFRWPLVPAEKLRDHAFSGYRLAGFVMINLVVLVPGVLLYMALCASLAVDHLSGSFLALNGDGLTVRVRKYVRDDGKSIQLIPMMHVGERHFYRQVSKLFQTNSVVLLEGVTDNKNLLKHKLRYDRMASSLGLAEQQEEFVPAHGRLRHADVDVEQFSPRTIEFLNVISLIHSKGLNFQTLKVLTEQSQTPIVAEDLWADLLTLRNEHLLKQIQAEQVRSDHIIVPWGAAHMPGLSREIQQSGFRLAATAEFEVLRFGTIIKRFRPGTR